jgi:dTDP-4-dehydrorhamnose reductase
MHYLIVGRGWTGNKMFNELVNRGHIVTLTPHHEAKQTILNGYYDCVINCAGVTGTPNVDACEDDKQHTIAGNAIFPAILFDACKENGIKFAHFSSGCIYEGTITSEYADPNFFGSIYSISKGVSDTYLRDEALVFRIRMPFTGLNEPKNYLYKVKNYSKFAKLYDAGNNSLTDLDEAVRVACDLIEDDEYGPVNLVNNGHLNMHEVAEILGLNAEWYTEEEFVSVTKAKRSTCVIPAHPAMSNLRSAIESAAEKMKKY